MSLTKVTSTMFDDVTAFGAVGNNVTDDSTAIQNAINATVSGAILRFGVGKTYYIGSRLVVNKPMTIIATGATIRFNATRSGGYDNDAISITSSNVKIVGGTWKEVAPTSTTGNHGIVFYGTENNSSTPPTYIENVGIQDATITDWQGTSLAFRMCKNFYVTNCEVTNVGFCAVETLSSNQGVIADNRIGDINPTGAIGSYEDSYGIAITLNNNGNTIGRPLSHDVSVTGNYVYNVKTWEGIDTHGGYNISVVGNVVKNCHTSIAMVSYVGGTSTTYDQGVQQCSVVGNTLENDSTIFSSRNGLGRGIVIDGQVGAGGSSGSNVVVSGNALRYCGGQETDDSLGAIECENVNNCNVTGNSISQSGSVGIMMWSCQNSLVDGNDIWQIDPYNATEFPNATVTFSGNPTAADTLTINGVVCTFVATPSAINSNTAIDVLIGANQAATITNLQNILITARDTGTASVMPNGRLAYTTFANNGTNFTIVYRYPTRMLSNNWTLSKSSSVISLSGAYLSIPTNDNGAGIKIRQLSGGVPPTGQISNNYIRNPNASGISIRGICQTSDSEIIYRNNSLSGKGVLYDIKGSSTMTCSDVHNLFENQIDNIDLPSIGSGSTYVFYLPYPTSYEATTLAFSGRYLNGMAYTIQRNTGFAEVQIYNPTSGSINIANDTWSYEVKYITNYSNFGAMN